jgi:peptide/nickel transport system ATP-binding protein
MTSGHIPAASTAPPASSSPAQSGPAPADSARSSPAEEGSGFGGGPGPVLGVRGLRIVRALPGASDTIVSGVSLAIGPGETIGIVGESGSGKSMTARAITGLLPPALTATGQVSYDGRDLAEAITTHDPKARSVPAQVTGLLESVGLPAAYAARKPVALSGGERQRVAIARALAARPKILICDEPVSALDVSVQAQILNLLTALRTDRGIGYLFITHDLSIVRQITEHVYVLYKGRIVESGPTEQVLTSPSDPYTVRLLQSVPSSDPGWLTAPRTLDTGSGTS